MNKLAKIRVERLKEAYEVSDPIDIKFIQLNQLIMVLDDLGYQSKEALDTIPDGEELKMCKTPQEIVEKSEKLIKSVRNIIDELTIQLEDLTEIDLFTSVDKGN